MRVADINECAVLNGQCRGTCINLLGGYHCACAAGYELDPSGRLCLDVNECHYNNGGCEHICLNAIGSYYCACHDGHQLYHNQRSCTGECALTSHNQRSCTGECALTSLRTYVTQQAQLYG